MRTPFYEIHRQLNAKIIDFGGFDMPVQYAGIRKEHMAVRTAAGLFDVSHMGEILIQGEHALKAIQYLTVNDVSRLQPGKAQYSCMCYEDGGIVDDLLVYMLDHNEYMLVVNAANIEKDYQWMLRNNKYNAGIRNISEQICLLAVQGPKAPDVIQKITDADVSAIRFYTFEKVQLAGFENVILSATGYTGEKGFEIYFNQEEIPPEKMWHAIMEAGAEFDIQPAGLGARDTLRLEMGYALYGNDISDTTNPIEAGLGWITRLDKKEFIGKPVLEELKNRPPQRVLTGIRTKDARTIPRKGYALYNDADEPVGEVTSGGLSITLGHGIGMGFVKKDYAEPGSNIRLVIRNKPEAAEVVRTPFISKK